VSERQYLEKSTRDLAKEAVELMDEIKSWVEPSENAKGE
jgi:hypothetical protein